MCYIQYCFFASGRGFDDQLVRLSLIKQVFKAASLMCIAIIVKNPQIFWESWMSLSIMSRTISNMYTYPINPQMVIKHMWKVMIRNQKIKRTFICGALCFKWMGVFQSWLNCFSIGVMAFTRIINFSSSVVFLYWCPFVTIVKWCNL